MFQVEGQNCIQIGNFQRVKKKSIQLSLFLDEQKAFRNIETVWLRTNPDNHSLLSSTRNGLLKKRDCTPSSINFIPKSLSTTPTLKNIPRKKISILSFDFQPQQKKKNENLVKNQKKISSCINQEIKSQTRGNTLSISRLRLENRITLKDLKLNLPIIIRNRRLRKRST